MSPLLSSEKIVNYWEADKITVMDTSFSKSLFLPENTNLITSHTYCQLFSLK